MDKHMGSHLKNGSRTTLIGKYRNRIQHHHAGIRSNYRAPYRSMSNKYPTLNVHCQEYVNKDDHCYCPYTAHAPNINCAVLVGI
ncbi:hypothetical protein CUMW_001530 [Citrus unshiu]|uniref:Uncharacterized protein n=1 Tax=Citrus sinensis TaxID=2711 RepID=A0A067FKZ7_CITSI|nr:hypothetical protein CISIN_1g044087mg [Citrus sinensis]GAY32272.1 hypothetical protein CUMW_001530 [Citrus unshiu]